MRITSVYSSILLPIEYLQIFGNRLTISIKPGCNHYYNQIIHGKLDEKGMVQKTK